jgi:hypothetical protein
MQQSKAKLNINPTTQQPTNHKGRWHCCQHCCLFAVGFGFGFGRPSPRFRIRIQKLEVVHQVSAKQVKRLRRAGGGSHVAGPVDGGEAEAVEQGGVASELR